MGASSPEWLVRPGENLAAIVDAAPGGAVLRLAPGEHRTNRAIFVPRALTLLADGPEVKCIRAPAPRQDEERFDGGDIFEVEKRLSLFCVLEPGHLSLRGISLHNVEGNVMVVQGGHLVAEDCLFTGAREHGSMFGPGTVSGTSPRHLGGDGLRLAGGRSRLVGCRFVGNECAGILVTGEGEIDAEGCELSRNGTGCSALGGSRIHIKDGHLEHNKAAGFTVHGRAELRAERCAIRNNRCGIDLRVGKAQLVACTLQDNRTPISSQQVGAVETLDCHFDDD